ncbi:MAG: choice-of-anchor I family protein [Candidatus Thiodiazotropha sp. DIVDIV]
MFCRKSLLVSGLLSATLSPAYAFDLQVTEIWMGNDPGANLTADWFEIVNTGDTSWTSGVDGELYYDDESADPTTADPISGISSIDPGESVIVLVTDTEGDIQEFINLWSPVYTLDNVKIGTVDGAGLGQGGDAVTLYVGLPDATTQVDYEAYPDANANGGQSYDVTAVTFSSEFASINVNDAGQSAIGTPGDLGAVVSLGDIPAITLLGDNPLITAVDRDYSDPGATAYDTEDGDLTDSIMVSGDSVDATSLGEYVVQYDVTDSDGNSAAPLSREVVVTYAETVPAGPAPEKPDLFKHLSTLSDLPGSEIPAYDRETRLAYVTSGDGLQIVDLSDIKNPVMGSLIDPMAEPFNLNSSAITSVDVCDGRIAFAVPNAVQTDNGSVVFLDKRGKLLHTVTVGALPDMVTFTGDCETLLVANEGEPDNGIDPEGSISIINSDSGKVKTADFTKFNGMEDTLRAQGVRIFPGVSSANDFEPEYIAVTKNNKTAYVVLQEANAVAVVNIKRAKVKRILPLGLKDHSLVGNELDASDRDSVINIRNWPLQGMYMPDGIAMFGKGRKHQYFITANEGDARDADERVKGLTLDPVVFPNADELQSDFNMGRIQVSSIDGDTDGDGDFDQLQSYGARSFSIWDLKGNLVYDSGSDIESIVATYGRDNADDGRSDNKGPEPEGVEVGRIGKRTYAFIGLERTSQVLVYDVSRPWSPRFMQILQHDMDEAPEGMTFLSRDESPNECPTLLVSNEKSNTLTIYQLSRCEK